MELQKLDPAATWLRDKTISEVNASTFTMRRDFGCNFTMHEIKDKGEVALVPADIAAGDYLRAYIVVTAEDRAQLIVDDVIYDDDEVDFANRIKWGAGEDGWGIEPIVGVSE